MILRYPRPSSLGALGRHSRRLSILRTPNIGCACLPPACSQRKTWVQLGSNYCQIRSKTVYHDAEQSQTDQQDRFFATALGAGGPRFESGRPDQIYLPYFRGLKENAIHVKLHCVSQAGRRSGFASRLIPKSSPRDGFARMRGGRRAIQKPLNESKLSARNLASMGKIRGPRVFLVSSISGNADRCSRTGPSPRFAVSLNLRF